VNLSPSENNVIDSGVCAGFVDPKDVSAAIERLSPDREHVCNESTKHQFKKMSEKTESRGCFYVAMSNAGTCVYHTLSMDRQHNA
jgi:hypothetical protein